MSNFCCNLDCDNIGNPWGYWGFTWKPCFQEKSGIPGASSLGEPEDYSRCYNSNPAIKYFDYRDDPTLATYDAEQFSWDLQVTKLKSYAMFDANAVDYSKYLRDNDWLVKPFSTYQYRQNHIVNFGQTEYDASTSNLHDLGYVGGDTSGTAVDFYETFDPEIGTHFVHRSTEGMRTIAHYVDDTQKYLICVGTTPIYERGEGLRGEWDRDTEPTTDPETETSYYINTDAFKWSEFRSSDPESDILALGINVLKAVISVIDIDTKEVLFCQPFNFSYENTLSDSIRYNHVFGEFIHAISRANFSGGKDYLIVSTYDDKTPTDQWCVFRVPLLDGPGLGTNGQKMKVPESDQYNVVRGPFHSYSYSADEDSFSPWVIAYRPEDTTWVTGQWLNDPDPPDEEGDSNNVAKLTEEEVVNVLSQEDMGVSAKLICYNRIRNRELCIWIDNGNIDDPYEWESGFAPSTVVGMDTVYSTGYYIKGIYVYDSDRPTDQFFKYSEKIVNIWPAGNGITVPDPCNTNDDGKTDDGIDGRYWSDGTKPSSRNQYVDIGHGHSINFATYRNNDDGQDVDWMDAPTFITCDDEDQVYIGSPAWISKVGRYADVPSISGSGRPIVNDSYWTYVFRDYYRKIVTTRPTACSGFSSGLIASTEPTEYQDSSFSRGVNYGRMDSRDFCILPTSKGIFIRGCEATPELSTVNWFDDTPYIRPRSYNPGTYSGEMPLRSTWLTDWIFSKNGNTRKPCIEEAFLQPKLMTISTLYPDDKISLPWDFLNGTAPCPFLLSTRNILYWKFHAQSRQAYLDGDCTLYSSIYPMPYLPAANKGARHTVSRRYGDQLAFNFYTKSTYNTSSYERPVICAEPYYLKSTASLYSDLYTSPGAAFGVGDQICFWADAYNNLDQNDETSLPSRMWGFANSDPAGGEAYWYYTGWFHYHQWDHTGFSESSDSSARYEELWEPDFALGWWGQKYAPWAILYQGIMLDAVDVDLE